MSWTAAAGTIRILRLRVAHRGRRSTFTSA
jgi:hypothetical protein